MKAAIYSKYGDPVKVLQVEEVEKPRPKPNEMLVKVFAASVNRTDEGIVTARYVVSRLYSGLLTPKKPIPGTDFAGVVEALGTSVTEFEVDDRVYGFDDEGISSHAEYLVISQDKAVAKMPKESSFAQAAASLEGFHYAYNFINKVKLEPSQKVLVNGATGAIGSAAVQILKYYGVQITAVANTNNVGLVKSLGARRVVDYLKEDFIKRLTPNPNANHSNEENATADENERYDFIFDAVGKSSFYKCKPLLKRNGIYISSELGSYGSNIILALTTPMMGGKKVIFPFPSHIKKSIAFVGQLIDEGKFRAVIDRTYPLEEIVDAFTYVQTGQKTGNVIIEMQPF